MNKAITKKSIKESECKNHKELQRYIKDLEKQNEVMQQLLEKHIRFEEAYRILLDESSDPIFAFNNAGVYLYVNRAFAEGVERPVEEIISKKIWDVFSKEEADKRYEAVKWVFSNKATKVIEVRVPTKAGDTYYITTAKPYFNSQGEVIVVICISKNITERKKMESELKYLSTHDILTGLYNRNFFEGEMERMGRDRSFPISMIICDVDGLKSVNDRYGHIDGDNLLRGLAEHMQTVFRPDDIIARIGGDEFGILLPHTDEKTTNTYIKQLESRLLELAGSELSLSIGTATAREDDLLQNVMRIADDRMYNMKMMRKSLNIEAFSLQTISEG